MEVLLPGPMPALCVDCPFRIGGHMRSSLGEERIAEIEDHVRGGGRFVCHKTIDYDLEEGTIEWIESKLNRERECAGAAKLRCTSSQTAGRSGFGET